jgi:energy-coupling factor transport system substrate-specific component
VATGENVSWEPGMGLVEALQHYWAFYVLTSFGWDAWNALANVVLILAVGGPLLRVLSRFHDRFMIDWR